MNKILVVDDEKIIRANFCEILDMAGFSAVEASNGNVALEIYRKERPSAVLLDLKMPGMNGIDTLKALKEIDPHLPVIVITSYGDVQTAVEAIQLGAHDFMLKPPDFSSLTIRLKKAIEKRELELKIQGLNTKIEASIENSLGVSSTMKKVIQQIQQVAGDEPEPRVGAARRVDPAAAEAGMSANPILPLSGQDPLSSAQEPSGPFFETYLPAVQH